MNETFRRVALSVSKNFQAAGTYSSTVHPPAPKLAELFAREQIHRSISSQKKQEINLRIILVVSLGIAFLCSTAGAWPAFADCRSENASCVKGAVSPFDSVACGSLNRTCAAHKAQAAQQQGRPPQNNKPAGGTHSGRR
jgi:hypothetical protein